MKNAILKQAEELKKQADEYMSAWEFDKAMKTLQKISDLLSKHGLQMSDLLSNTAYTE